MKRLLIVGAGGHGRVVKEVAEATDEFEKIDFLDDNSEDTVGKTDDLKKLYGEYDSAFVGVGNNMFRMECIAKIKEVGYQIPTLIHPTAYISKSANIELGTVVEPKALVNANTKIGEGCIISVWTIIDHNVVVEDGVHVNARAIVRAGAHIAALSKLEAGEVILGYESARVSRK
ncbi:MULTISPECIES: PglD-related sugar-binding protein [Blautia]|uniref:PglD-related sugar-binding protein n=1 Tax=Blautia TaxID=572511 RepID=UPI000BA37A4A|nr:MULTISPECIES: PglB [Blautia]